jgi:hypothetical protein
MAAPLLQEGLRGLAIRCARDSVASSAESLAQPLRQLLDGR